MARGRAVVFGVAMLAPAGCSLLVDSTGLFGGPGDGGSGSEGSVTAEAGVDALIDAGVDAFASECDASFCDDFDHGSLGARWSEIQKDNNRLTLDPSSGLSAPAALDLVLGSPPGVGLTKRWGHITAISCAFDLRVDKTGNNDGDYLDGVFIRLKSDAISRFDLFYDFTSKESLGGLSYDDPTGGKGDTKTWPRPVVGTWFHVEFKTDLKTFTLSTDGIERVNIVLPAIDPTSAALLLGGSSRTSSVWELHADNLICSIGE